MFKLLSLVFLILSILLVSQYVTLVHQVKLPLTLYLTLPHIPHLSQVTAVCIGFFYFTTFISFYLGGTVVQESLLVVRDLGIQVSTKTYSGKETKVFHDISRIRDCVLNEYVTFWYVRQYLAIIIENEKQMVVPFRNCSKLRQIDLEYIYTSVKQMLNY